MFVKIFSADILDSFDDGRSILLPKDKFSNLSLLQVIDIEDKTYVIENIIKSKNRIMLRIK